MTISTADRFRYYGEPCRRERYLTCELWGHRVVVHPLLHGHLIRTAIASHVALNAIGAGDQVPRRMDSYACRPIRDRAMDEEQAGSTDGGGDHLALGPNRATRWSMHAFGLAWDLFMTPPNVVPPGGVWTPRDRLHPVLVATFERAGFTWGGRWRRVDQPHFEWSAPPP